MKLLCLAALTLASFAYAQEPRYFLLELELAPSVDVMHLTQAQMAILQQHGAQLMKLRDQGAVVMGGHTDNPKHMVAIVIVKARDKAAAEALAAGDPAVKAGLMKPTVEPFTLAIPPK